MHELKIIFAGFGGQGILSMGKFLAHAGMDENLNVSWLPSYGPEMRGGTANCSVILTKSDIGSPIIYSADAVVAMTRPALDKFEDQIVSGGLLIYDSDLITRQPARSDITAIKIPAQTRAESIGNKKIANMILLGALIAKTKIISVDSLLDSLKEHGKEGFYEINKKAINEGIGYGV